MRNMTKLLNYVRGVLNNLFVNFEHRNGVWTSREYANLEKAFRLIYTIFNESI